MLEFLRSAADDIQFLRSNYPHFDEWFLSKVVPGIYRGERTAVVEQRGTAVAGLLIVKHTAYEKKLCTLRVRPEFECRGLGVRMFETAFDLLGTERPLLSVSDNSMAKFARLFAHFGFAQEAVYEGRYVPLVDEFAYNGVLDLPNDADQGSSDAGNAHAQYECVRNLYRAGRRQLTPQKRLLMPALAEDSRFDT